MIWLSLLWKPTWNQYATQPSILSAIHTHLNHQEKQSLLKQYLHNALWMPFFILFEKIDKIYIYSKYY